MIHPTWAIRAGRRTGWRARRRGRRTRSPHRRTKCANRFSAPRESRAPPGRRARDSRIEQPTTRCAPGPADRAGGLGGARSPPSSRVARRAWREVVAAKGLDAFETSRGARAQVGAHEVEGAAPGRAVERADLAEDARDRLVALRHLEDDVHGELHEPYCILAPAGRSRSRVRRARRPSLDPARTIPFDSTPISLAGWRLATTTTFLPRVGRGVVLGDAGEHGAGLVAQRDRQPQELLRLGHRLRRDDFRHAQIDPREVIDGNALRRSVGIRRRGARRPPRPRLDADSLAKAPAPGSQRRSLASLATRGKRPESLRTGVPGGRPPHSASARVSRRGGRGPRGSSRRRGARMDRGRCRDSAWTRRACRARCRRRGRRADPWPASTAARRRHSG